MTGLFMALLVKKTNDLMMSCGFFSQACRTKDKLLKNFGFFNIACVCTKQYSTIFESGVIHG